MRQHETLRDIMDGIGQYETALETATIGNHIRYYETL